VQIDEEGGRRKGDFTSLPSLCQLS
jgi:hypothetical protein